MGSSIIGILSGLIAVPKVATVVGLMLGLGVGIDYALFVLSRHRQNLSQGMSVPQATGHANATAGLSVLFAGVTVVVAIAGMQISGIPMLAVMGWASALMVAVTMLAALTLLPALLGLAGRRVNSLRVPFTRTQSGYDPGSRAARWAAFVVRKPVGIGIAAVLVLVALTLPVISMRLGWRRRRLWLSRGRSGLKSSRPLLRRSRRRFLRGGRIRTRLRITIRRLKTMFSRVFMRAFRRSCRSQRRGLPRLGVVATAR